MKSVTPARCPRQDLRGHNACLRRIPPEVVDRAIEHILSFPTVSSHYTRAKSPHMRYLDGNLNVKKMFRLYLLWMEENFPNERKVKLSYYRTKFKGFHLGFRPPMIDTCSRRDSLSKNIDGSTPPCSASRTPAGPLSIASVSSEAFSPVQSPGLSSTGSSEHELLLDKDMDLKLEIKEEVVDDALREFVKVLDHVEEPPDPKEDDVDVVASTSASSSNIEFVDMIPHQMEIPSDPKEDPVDVLAVTKPSSIPSTSSVLLKKAGPAPLRVEDVDEFQLFGMFVASQLRALPLRDALQAQLEIQTLLAQKRSQRLT